MSDLPQKARAVIIGGGVIGCSVAYHLTLLGWKDVVLLERKRLTSGTTWHAAGLIAQLRATLNMTLLAKYSADLYDRLEAETGVATGYRRNGAITLALTAGRFEELRRLASMAKPFGIEVEPISAAEAAGRHPLIETGDVTGAVWMPLDGQADPTNIAMALAKGARLRGARIFENVAVTGIMQSKGRATGVLTAGGSIEADVVINCAGLWAREVGAMAGVPVPLQACEHFYVVTEPVAGLPRNAPVLRVPDECSYFKEDAGKLLVGFFEPKAKTLGGRRGPGRLRIRHPARRLGSMFRRNWRRPWRGFPRWARPASGPSSTGRKASRPTIAICSGNRRCCAISSSPPGSTPWASSPPAAPARRWPNGSTPASRAWIFRTSISGACFRSRRRSPTSLRGVEETLGLLFADHWPYRQYATSRAVRHTPAHEALAARGGCFGEAAGFERPLFYATAAQMAAGALPELTFGWERQPWFANVAGEHAAIRENVAVIDMSPFGKIRVVGRDAFAVLQRICANDIDVPIGRLVYTQWLNARGGIEADLTVARLSETEFLIVTSAAAVTRDMAWLRRLFRKMPIVRPSM